MTSDNNYAIRELLVLGEAEWSWLEEIAERGHLGQVLVEFWRKALGYTMEDWMNLPKDSFKVTDYVVSRATHDRLYELAKSKSNGKADVMALAMMWLDVGPAVQDGADDEQTTQNGENNG